ncbi:MAG: hypothetical protein ACRD6W_00825, partial [Nitrososphaerales archaeon]
MKTSTPVTNKPTEIRTCEHHGSQVFVKYGPYSNGKSFWRCILCQRTTRANQYVKNPKKEQKRAHDWMKANPERAKEIHHTTYRNRREKNRTLVLMHYSGGY